MIKMSVEFFDGEECFIAELTDYSLAIFFLLITAAITIVNFFLGYFLHSITC